MKEVIDFFRRLHDNNDRAWFDVHRAEWTHVKGRFAAFTERLIEGIAEFDPAVRGLRVQDCTYRIARDTRFSPDKSPYKTYIGAYIAPKGKKSGFAGYYFHIEPCCDSLIWSNALSAGLYCPEPVVLRSVREEILDNGAEIAAAIRKAKGFGIVEENKLKRVPTGFPADSEYAEMLKLKDFYIAKKITEEFLLSDDLLERVAQDLPRKLAKGDRVVGPALCCLRHGRVPHFLAKVLAAAYYFKNEQDAGAQEVQKEISQRGIEAAIERFSGLSESVLEEKALKQMVVARYYEMADREAEEIPY